MCHTTPPARWALRLKLPVLLAALGPGLAASVPAAAAGLAGPTECIVPAKPGGGFDLSCKLAQGGLLAGGFITQPMRVTYMPGGIGAVAYNTVVAQRPADARAIVAFSGGSLLNLAQGKFGRHTGHEVRWLAAVGTDYGAVVVAASSPYKTLADVMAAWKADPGKVVLGAGGTLGSQDWMKAALLARAAGVNPKAMRFVAFEGGGQAITALQGGHIQVLTGDVAETLQQLRAGRQLRILAVMAERRLPGELADVPTAREAGADVLWPIVRGFYMGPQVPADDYRAWTEAFQRLMASPAYERLRSERGLYSLSLVGPELDAYVQRQIAQYRGLVAEVGLQAAR